jgi:hypothetical protein
MFNIEAKLKLEIELEELTNFSCSKSLGHPKR